MPEMSEGTLVATIDNRISTGLGSKDGELTTSREELLDRYFGKKYGNEVTGQSQVTTREVLEAVEWTMPSLMRIFSGNDQVVIFEPTGPEDEKSAKQESEYVNHVFKKENDGFTILYDFCKDTLLNPTAYVKCWVEEEEDTESQTYYGIDLFAMSSMLQDGFELTAATTLENGLFDAKFTKTTVSRNIKVACVPTNELVIDEKLTSWNIEEGDFINHRRELSATDLVEMGFDPDIAIEAINKAIEEKNEEQDNTVQFTDELDDGDENDETTKTALIDETYIKVDFDGDGIAEWRKVLKAGTYVLENEDIEYFPYISMSAIRMPHRHLGVAWAELVKDIQKIKTTLMRQLLNNMYRVNNPRPIIGPGVNMDDVLNDVPNSPIRAQRVDNYRIEPTMPIIGQVIPALQLLDEQKESRIGVSRNSMGLDADVLAESTRGAYMGAMEQANQRLELLARLLAETGIKKMFLKIHELSLKYQDQQKVVKLLNEWTPINPSEWKHRYNMTAIVGVGFSTKEQQMMSLDIIYNKQKEIAQAGSKIVSESNIYNTLVKAVELTNLGDPTRYFTDPTTVPPDPPKPSPEEMLMQIEQMKIEVDKMVKAKQAQQKDRELALKEEDAAVKHIEAMTKLEIDANKDLGPEGRAH